MVDAPVTRRQVIAAAADLLADTPLADRPREAWQLWRATQSDGLPAVDGAALDDATVAAFMAAVRRRATGEPFAYVAGRTGFRHLMLGCDRRALIPRPETEGLVELALVRCRTGVAVDIGTGTGAIALSLRQEGSFDRVIGSDLSRDALALARENALATRQPVDLVRADLLNGFGDASVDLVVANPPYLTSAEFDALDRSVGEFEPAVALVSGSDGLRHSRALLLDSRRVLRRGGWAALEIDARRGRESAAMAADAGYDDVTVLDDLFGRARYLLARWGAPR